MKLRRGALAMGALAMTTMAGLFACNAILGNEERRLASERAGDAAAGADRDGTTNVIADSACGADLSSDRDNCGACGHSCMGGSCSNGKCGPFTIVSNQVKPSNLVVNGGVAYWTNGDGRAMSCPLVGCNGMPKTLMAIDAGSPTGNPLPSALDVHGDTAYLVGYYTHEIITCPTSGCTAPTTLARNLDHPEDTRVDDSGAYFVSANGAFIGRCGLPSCDGGVVRLTSPATPAWHGMTIDDTHVYWYATPNDRPDTGEIYRVAKDAADAAAEQLLTDVIGPYALRAKNGTLYLSYGGSVIVKVSLGPGLFQFPLARQERGAGDLAVDDRYVYWTALGKGDIRRCKIAGCDLQPESVATGENAPSSVTFDDKAIYWTEYLGGTVRGLAKPLD